MVGKITVRELAELRGVSRRTVWSWIKRHGWQVEHEQNRWGSRTAFLNLEEVNGTVPLQAAASESDNSSENLPVQANDAIKPLSEALCGLAMAIDTEPLIDELARLREALRRQEKPHRFLTLALAFGLGIAVSAGVVIIITVLKINL